MRRLKLFLGMLLLLMPAYLLQSQDIKKDQKKEQEEWIKQDWPDLAKYREENERLGPPAINEHRVVFMGNSITEGWGNAAPDFFRNGYINRGISGQTTPQMLIRFRPDVIELNPEVVVILAGTNDIAGNTGYASLDMIEDNLASMTDLSKANGIKVILCSVLPAYDFPWRKGLKPAEKIAELNAWIENYANKNNLIYLDYYSSMVDERKGLKAAYTRDGVHPNEAGYQVMKNLVEEAIAQALNR